MSDTQKDASGATRREGGTPPSSQGAAKGEAKRKPSFDVTREDAKVIWAIVERGARLVQAMGSGFDRLSASMDITACHANGTPLRLQEFLDADDFNFAHDFGGIRRHIDRRTGKLGDCFVPRFSR